MGSRFAWAAAGLALLLPGAARAADGAVALKKVKYDELAKYLATLKGKVIVVDFWATY